jgi:mannosyl-oligosaccharide alpha-1,2-mannosidase
MNKLNCLQRSRASASRPHKAGTRVVLAELGTLSLEFTRLAQLTKNARYYDAVARITDAFEQWQNSTRLPGMWPIMVDASGCNRVNHAAAHEANEGVHTPQREPMTQVLGKLLGDLGDGNDQHAAHPEDSSQTEPEVAAEMTPFTRPSPIVFSTPDEPEGRLKKRQDDGEDETSNLDSSESRGFKNRDPKDDCISQGLASPSTYGTDTFSLGGMSDSTYEYLPKVFIYNEEQRAQADIFRNTCYSGAVRKSTGQCMKNPPMPQLKT